MTTVRHCHMRPSNIMITLYILTMYSRLGVQANQVAPGPCRVPSQPAKSEARWYITPSASNVQIGQKGVA